MNEVLTNQVVCQTAEAYSASSFLLGALVVAVLALIATVCFLARPR